MSRRVVEVTTGSRLHFGMMSFGVPHTRQFGGVGAMIDGPGYKLRLTPADELTIEGPDATRARLHVEAVARSEWFDRAPRCRVEIVGAPPTHVGLGSGTQLALAVVVGMSALYDRAPLAASQMARVVGRGRRSAIGLYGFLHGGLLVEAGKFDEEELSPLVSRIELPEAWRFLLVHQNGSEGLSGEAERQAFARLPPVPAEVTAAMCREALLGLLPAAAQNRHDEFCAALERFGKAAGSCFAPLQGGIYASRQISAVVQTLEELGLRGVGQSSWGPMVFAVCENQAAAERAAARLPLHPATAGTTCIIAKPRATGARIEVREE